jgi:hypothetical protein
VLTLAACIRSERGPKRAEVTGVATFVNASADW